MLDEPFVRISCASGHERVDHERVPEEGSSLRVTIPWVEFDDTF
jgi:hypothetical protein